MQHSRLSEIDLARALSIAPGPALEAQMRRYNAGGGAWSYDPTRSSTSDLVGAISRLVGALPPPPWLGLERQITQACNRGERQVRANLQVSKILFDAAVASSWSAVQEPMGWLSVGFGGSVRYWSDIVIADAEGPFIPFFDHRRSGGLAASEARRIVFSMQHVGVRELNPDLADYRLAVVRFPSIGDTRHLQVDFHDESELLPYEELNDRITTVYVT